jgi:hypothetical protein
VLALATASACGIGAGRVVGFSGRLRRMIDAAAVEAGLTPLDALERAPIPTGAPRTA